MDCSDHYIHTWCLYIYRGPPYVRPHLKKNLTKQSNFQVRIVLATAGGLWVWPRGLLMTCNCHVKVC